MLTKAEPDHKIVERIENSLQYDSKMRYSLSPLAEKVALNQIQTIFVVFCNRQNQLRAVTHCYNISFHSSNGGGE